MQKDVDDLSQQVDETDLGEVKEAGEKANDGDKAEDGKVDSTAGQEE